MAAISLARTVVSSLVLCVLFSASANAEGLSQSTVPVLIDKAKAALVADDMQTFDDLLMQLFERITGIPAQASEIPDGMSDDEFVKRYCDYDRLTEPLFTPKHLELLRYDLALTGYAAVSLERDGDVYIRSMAQCVFNDGQPTRRAQFMQDGIAWAKTFKAANAAQAQGLAQEIVSLAAKHPDIDQLAILADMVRIAAEEKQDAEQSKANDDERRMARLGDQIDLVGRADKGSLSAQLEVARRLETGNKFRQDFAMAYFWYQRAFNNSGGKIAQAGMDRILFQLTDVDFIKIDVWTRRHHRPF